MEILKQGAEAILYKDKWEGYTVLVKERISKGYRIPEIDEKLRKERTNREAKLLRDARTRKVPTPHVFDVDKKNFKIIMEFLDGITVKDFLSKSKQGEFEEVCRRIGANIAKLHGSDIIHGDLTTSNMIKKNSEIYFIDFGLGKYSTRVEDKGVDLRVLKDAIEATHYDKFDECWNEIVKGYMKEYKSAEIVLKKVEEISRRGRYAKRN